MRLTRISRPLRFKLHIRGFAACTVRLREPKPHPVFYVPNLFQDGHLDPVEVPEYEPEELPSPVPTFEEKEEIGPTPKTLTPIRAYGALAGKRAIITGASRGIGAAIAERFAKEGARCVLVGRDIDALTRVKENLVGEYKSDHVVKAGDVTDVEFWRKLAKSAQVSLFWIIYVVVWCHGSQG